MRHISWLTRLVWPTLFLLAGCGDNGSIVSQPSVSLVNSRIRNPTYSDATAVFTLGIENPNPFGMNVRGFNYDVSLNQRHLFNGKLATPLNLPAQGKTTVELPVHFSYLEVFSSVAEVFRVGASPYQLQGTVDFGIVQVPFKMNGELRFPRPPIE